MKTVNKFFAVLIAAAIMVSSSVVFAQTPDSTGNKTRQRFATKTEPQDATAKTAKRADDGMATKDEAPASDSGTKNLESVLLADPADSKKAGNDGTSITEDAQANRHEQASEEAAVVPYYNNFFNTYRLGPEDIVSVNVFGQDRYSRSGIIIPPSGRISLALIPGGIFVNGKTVDEVSETIKKRYDEYIIDPQVTVSLDKASSYRYSVIGDVGQPGIRMMSHRMTVTEAIGEAGGVLSTGDRSKVVVLRRQADGNLTPIAVNISAIYKGKAPDITYLVPGDQVIVPGNRLKSFQKIMTFFPILSFARIFTGGLLP
ncbi:MAG TPA: polysaccharide biosynthesis/export family protein [Pyrinomonadaceae bacterium]|nr:polysaccharide biosynthesis/export family protein [Pyrinomonadaceae bacterium]